MLRSILRPSLLIVPLSGDPASSRISRTSEVWESTCVPMIPFVSVLWTRACSVVSVKLSGTRISGLAAFLMVSSIHGISAGARDTRITTGPFISSPPRMDLLYRFFSSLSRDTRIPAKKWQSCLFSCILVHRHYGGWSFTSIRRNVRYSTAVVCLIFQIPILFHVSDGDWYQILVCGFSVNQIQL